MVDKRIPLAAPGIAGFATESIGNAAEPRFGEGVPTTTTEAVGENTELVLYQIVGRDANGVLVPAVWNADYAADGVRPFGITTAPITTGAGEAGTIDVYREGHWDMDALVWDDSFDTDEKKKRAFEGSLSPDIFISKKKFNDSAIDA